jgi:hypothetical protein
MSIEMENSWLEEKDCQGIRLLFKKNLKALKVQENGGG